MLKGHSIARLVASRASAAPMQRRRRFAWKAGLTCLLPPYSLGFFTGSPSMNAACTALQMDSSVNRIPALLSTAWRRTCKVYVLRLVAVDMRHLQPSVPSAATGYKAGSAHPTARLPRPARHQPTLSLNTDLHDVQQHDLVRRVVRGLKLALRCVLHNLVDGCLRVEGVGGCIRCRHRK